MIYIYPEVLWGITYRGPYALGKLRNHVLYTPSVYSSWIERVRVSNGVTMIYMYPEVLWGITYRGPYTLSKLRNHVSIPPVPPWDWSFVSFIPFLMIFFPFSWVLFPFSWVLFLFSWVLFLFSWGLSPYSWVLFRTPEKVLFLKKSPPVWLKSCGRPWYGPSYSTVRLRSLGSA